MVGVSRNADRMPAAISTAVEGRNHSTNARTPVPSRPMATPRAPLFLLKTRQVASSIPGRIKRLKHPAQCVDAPRAACYFVEHVPARPLRACFAKEYGKCARN